MIVNEAIGHDMVVPYRSMGGIAVVELGRLVTTQELWIKKEIYLPLLLLTMLALGVVDVVSRSQLC